MCNFPYQSVGVSLFMALALALPTAAASYSPWISPIIHGNWQKQSANKKNICNYTLIVLFFPSSLH